MNIKETIRVLRSHGFTVSADGTLGRSHVMGSQDGLRVDCRHGNRTKGGRHLACIFAHASRAGDYHKASTADHLAAAKSVSAMFPNIPVHTLSVSVKPTKITVVNGKVTNPKKYKQPQGETHDN